jgi:hypothetical protein
MQFVVSVLVAVVVVVVVVVVVIVGVMHSFGEEFVTSTPILSKINLSNKT